MSETPETIIQNIETMLRECDAILTGQKPEIPTPRTDNCAKSADRYGDMNVVPASFARELERENAKLREALMPFVRYLDGLKPDAMTQDVWRDYRTAKVALGEPI